MITLAFTLPRGTELTSNGRYHYRVKADRTRNLREQATWTARNHLTTHGHTHLTYPVTLTATIAYPSHRRSDPDNYHPTVKALVDGIVQAGLLDDDDHTHIEETRYRRDPSPAAKGTHRVTITIKETDD